MKCNFLELQIKKRIMNRLKNGPVEMDEGQEPEEA